MNFQHLVILCWIINLRHILFAMGDTILKQSTNYRHRRSTDNEHNPTRIRDIVLSQLFSNERDHILSESQTKEATRLRQTRQLRQSSESDRRQSRRESQLQEFESLFSNIHNGHRHASSSWRKQSTRLYKQMVAQNVTNSQTSTAESDEEQRVYATIHLEANKLPQYSK